MANSYKTSRTPFHQKVSQKITLKNRATIEAGEDDEQDLPDVARLKENSSQARLIVDKNTQQLDQTMSKLLKKDPSCEALLPGLGLLTIDEKI